MVHVVFDVLAAVSALTITWVIFSGHLADRAKLIERAGMGYAIALIAGAVFGGYVLGSLNLVLSGHPGLGRSIIGALGGAILAIEAFKRAKGIRGSTGLVFVPAFCITVVIGRIGCFLSGIDDFTYGVATQLPWGHDFGDGVSRHPVQLYEAAAMAVFLSAALPRLWARDPFMLRNGFYLMVGWYALQRYGWEFLKPYETVVAGQNVFHLTALGLIVYAIVMSREGEHEGVQRA